MELREVQVGDWYMKYDPETCRGGVRYLLDELGREERKVFFDRAYEREWAEFEDRDGRNYTLYYQRNNVYLLTRRRNDW